MIQEKEVKHHVKENLKKLYDSLLDKRIKKGKLLQDEEIIFQAIKDPSKGDIKITVVYDNDFHIFIESKRHNNTYFSVMNDKEASRFSDRRPFDHYIYSSDPNENFNIYIASINDMEILKKARNSQNIWQFYSIELGIYQPKLQEKEVLPENIELLEWDQKWDIYKKLPDIDPRKQELKNQLFGFNLKYKKYKETNEDERFILIEPVRVTELVGMIAREIYPINLRNVLRRDYKKEHIALITYTRHILENFFNEVENRRKLFNNSFDYIEYLNALEKEILRQINLLE